MYWYILVYFLMVIMISLLHMGGISCMTWSVDEK